MPRLPQGLEEKAPDSFFINSIINPHGLEKEEVYMGRVRCEE